MRRQKPFLLALVLVPTALSAYLLLRYHRPIEPLTVKATPRSWKFERVGPLRRNHKTIMPNPIVVQSGAPSVFPYDSSGPPIGANNVWIVFDPASSPIATAAFGAANNGITANFSNPDFTVTDSGGMAPGTGYKVAGAVSGTGYEAFFDVVAPTPPVNQQGGLGMLLREHR